MSATASYMAARGLRHQRSSPREVLAELHDLMPLAPLHQPHNLAAIEAVFERMPDVPQVACFDTSFHRGHSPVAKLVPLPREICARRACSATAFMACPTNTSLPSCPRWRRKSPGGRVIVAHLGSGASLCALKDGKSVDTSLGFTALDGLCMGTRPGAIDPGVVLYLFQNLGLSAKEVETILYKKSGLLGISGISNDMRDLLGKQRTGGPPGSGLLRLPRGQGDRRSGRGPGRNRWTGVHRRHRRELDRDPPANLRIFRLARDSN